MENSRISHGTRTTTVDTENSLDCIKKVKCKIVFLETARKSILCNSNGQQTIRIHFLPPPRPVMYSCPQITGFNSFKLTWTLQLEKYHSPIKNFEVFACVQRKHAKFISPWKKIAEVRPPFENGHNVSKSFSGFDEGYRYQIAVRGVDFMKNEGPFSQPIYVTLPNNKCR